MAVAGGELRVRGAAVAAVGVEAPRAGAAPPTWAGWDGMQAESARGGRAGVARIDTRVHRNACENVLYGAHRHVGGAPRPEYT